VGKVFAGVVGELGPDVPEGVRTVDERIAGMIRGSRCRFFLFPLTSSVGGPALNQNGSQRT
jgi:hypothetical protein